jgi:hypothetical protein
MSEFSSRSPSGGLQLIQASKALHFGALACLNSAERVNHFDNGMADVARKYAAFGLT